MKHIVICLALVTTAAAPAMADHRPGHHTPLGHLNRDSSSTVITEPGVFIRLPGIRFSVTDHRNAVDYYRTYPSAFGPISALPPGIARQLARGRDLPPGIARRAAPAGLINVLSPVPDGFSLVVVGDHLVMLHISTNVIYDVIQLLGG